MRFAAIIVVLLVGCGREAVPIASSPTDVESTKAQQDASDVDDLQDVNLDPSEKSLADVEAFLKPGMTTDQLHDFVKTTPILVKERRFHWMLSDGSLWTDVKASKDGAVIVDTHTEKKSP